MAARVLIKLHSMDGEEVPHHLYAMAAQNPELSIPELEKVISDALPILEECLDIYNVTDTGKAGIKGLVAHSLREAYKAGALYGE